MELRTQESRTAAARALLIGSAIELLADAGFARATSASIAVKAGVSTGALHHHFPAKEALFLAVLDELADRALELFRGMGSSDGYPASPAEAIVADLWSLYGSKQYWAVWEINMGYRADEEMHRALVQHRAATRIKMLEVLDANVHLSAAVKGALVSELSFILSSMRGIFLDTFFSSIDDKLLSSELDALVSVLQARITKA